MSQPEVSKYIHSPEKRILDLFVASTLGTLAMAGGAFTGAGIAVTNGVNPLFLQERVGAAGKLYAVIKLRTMSNEGEILKWAGPIRKTGLDETPQFINVLLGNMSAVGYRPLIVGDINHATQRLKDHFSTRSPQHPDRWLALREQANPGITGPSQTMPLRPDAGSLPHLVDVVEAECAYLETASVRADVDLMLKTLGALAHGHNFTVPREA